MESKLLYSTWYMRLFSMYLLRLTTAGLIPIKDFHIFAVNFLNKEKLVYRNLIDIPYG